MPQCDGLCHIQPSILDNGKPCNAIWLYCNKSNQRLEYNYELFSLILRSFFINGQLLSADIKVDKLEEMHVNLFCSMA